MMITTNENGGNDTNGNAGGPATLPTPIPQSVRDGVARLAAQLAEAQSHLDGIHSAGDMSSPTVEGLHGEIGSLSHDLDDARSSQIAETQKIKTRVESQLKVEITNVLSEKIDSEIFNEIQSQVKAEVNDWGINNPLADSLRKTLEEDEIVLRDVQIQLNNSQARRENSTFDEFYDLDKQIHVVSNSGGHKSDLYPENLRQLFQYNDAKIQRLLQFYELLDCGSKIDNLNRFIAFIGLRFTIRPGDSSL